MGLTGELVRSVFSRNRSFGTQESNARSNANDKKRWISVRSYLCGDEFNSVLAEEDSASVKSSEATVTQPITDSSRDKEEIQSDEAKPNAPEEKHNSISKLFHEEDAAMVIQSAFRQFLARRRNQEIKVEDEKQVAPARTDSPSRVSIGTSIEVQTGNSVDVCSVQEESKTVHHRMQQKPKAQILRIKEDWDDSTVSSNISKQRIQNKLEAMTRRERALAYAFSQQLRVCSKKKQAKPDGTEQNMSWSWLERWMATRVPESSLVDIATSKQFEQLDLNRKIVVRKRIIDVAGEEKESCGSNEVSAQLESLSVTPTPKKEDDCMPSKDRVKATRTISRRKTAPSYQLTREPGKVSKRDGPRGNVRFKKHKSKQLVGKNEVECNQAFDQISLASLTS